MAASTVEVRPDPGAWLQRDLDLAQWLHGAAIPVARPSPEVPATVHHGDGHVMSFWRFVPPAGDHRPDESLFGSMLRDLHLALRSYPETPPPPLAPLQDIPAFLGRPQTQLTAEREGRPGRRLPAADRRAGPASRYPGAARRRRDRQRDAHRGRRLALA